MILKIIFSLLFLPLLFASLLWWSGVTQQKEYRIDRIKSYLASLTWKGWLIAIFPVLELVNTKRLRRPVRTWRSMIVLLLSGLTLLTIFVGIVNWSQQSLYLQNSRFYITTISLVFTTPFIIFLWSSFSSIPVWAVTVWHLGKLRKLIIKYQPTVIGITGSYGKTTTKQLLTHVLKSAAKVFTTPGSINTPYAIARHFLKSYKGEKIVILEFAAYCEGEIARLAQVFEPHAAILTGFNQQHLALFGSRKKIAEAKAELVEALPKTGVVTLATPETVEIFEALKNKDKVKLRKSWEEAAAHFSLSASGRLSIKLESIGVQTEIIGLQAAPAVSVAVLFARDFGIQEEQIAQSLRSFRPLKNWMRRQEHSSGATIINDGLSSNPIGFQAAIGFINHLNPEKAILATAGIVDLGEESRKTHVDLASVARPVFDEVWYLGAEGRSQFANTFKQDLFLDQTEIEQKLRELSSEALILVEGKLPSWFEKELGL